MGRNGPPTRHSALKLVLETTLFCFVKRSVSVVEFVRAHYSDIVSAGIASVKRNPKSYAQRGALCPDFNESGLLSNWSGISKKRI